MTLNKAKLRAMAKFAHIHLSKEQEVAILERFGIEPEPYEWSEQDIAIQIQNYLGCGEFVKLIHNSSNGESTIPVDEPF